MLIQTSFLIILKNEKTEHLTESIRRVLQKKNNVWLVTKWYQFQTSNKRVSNLDQLCKIAKYTVLPRKIGEGKQPEQVMNYFEGAKVCVPGKASCLSRMYNLYDINYIIIWSFESVVFVEHYIETLLSVVYWYWTRYLARSGSQFVSTLFQSQFSPKSDGEISGSGSLSFMARMLMNSKR